MCLSRELNNGEVVLITGGTILISNYGFATHRMNGALKNRTPGPGYIKIGRSIRYLKDNLDLWLEQHRQRVAA